MLDWFTVKVGYDGSGLQLGHFIEVDHYGEVVYKIERPLKARGSYEGSMRLYRDEGSERMRRQVDKLGLAYAPCCIRLDGSPIKFLQGHNVFGQSVDCKVELIRQSVMRLASEANLHCWPYSSPSMDESRIDIATMIKLGSHQAVHDWLWKASKTTRSRHGLPESAIEYRQSRLLQSGDTVYWGKHSRRWSLKGYCKYCELLEHKRHDKLPEDIFETLRDYSNGMLRLELTLRTPELAKRRVLTEKLVFVYLERIGVSEMDCNGNENRSNLKPQVEAFLELWLAGADVRHRLPSKTFYRYRKLILEEVGVDISLPKSELPGEVAKARIDLDYLKENEVKGVPDYLQGLLFKPAPYTALPENR